MPVLTQWFYFPPAVRSHSKTDVSQIIFVRQSFSVVGYYGGSGKEAIGGKLDARVIEVGSGQLVAVFEATGSPPGSISTSGLGWTASRHSASLDMAWKLLKWIEYQEYIYSPDRWSSWTPE
jgi:hypothetical protein